MSDQVSIESRARGEPNNWLYLRQKNKFKLKGEIKNDNKK